MYEEFCYRRLYFFARIESIAKRSSSYLDITSDDASYVTGHVYGVTGGMDMGA